MELVRSVEMKMFMKYHQNESIVHPLCLSHSEFFFVWRCVWLHKVWSFGCNWMYIFWKGITWNGLFLRIPKKNYHLYGMQNKSDSKNLCGINGIKKNVVIVHSEWKMSVNRWNGIKNYLRIFFIKLTYYVTHLL